LSDENTFFHPDPTIDLVALDIGSEWTALESENHEPYLPLLSAEQVLPQSELSEIGAAADVLMIGYPQGIWDSRNNQPLIRRGIAATHPAVRFEGRPEFLLDVACFPGSSGSPVFLYEAGTYLTPKKEGGNNIQFGSRVHLIGVVWGYHRYDASGKAIACTIPDEATGAAIGSGLHLGYAIHATELAEIDKLVMAAVART
jgi:hypothetical protein